MDIKDILADYGLTMTELSRLYGIPYRTIQDWNSGKRKAPDYVLTMLNRCLKQDKTERFTTNLP